MNKILTIAKKEWRNYFSSPVGYVFAALLLIVSSWMFFGDLFLLGQAKVAQTMLAHHTAMRQAGMDEQLAQADFERQQQLMAQQAAMPQGGE